MCNLLKQKWLPVLFLMLACSFVGCSAEAKRERYLKRAQAYFEKEEYVKAEIEFQNAARLSKKVDPLIVARVATLYYEQGRFMESFRLLSNAVFLNPNDLELRYKRGTILISTGSYSNAQQEASFILDRDAAHRNALLLLADSAQKPADIAAVKRKINEIKSKTGDAAALHVALAQMALREKQIEVAENEIALALRLDAKSSPANVLRAQIAKLRNRPEEVEQFLRVAAENSPPRSPRRLLLAQHKMQGTNVAEAKSIVDKLLQETPDYVPTWVLRGQIAMLEKDFAECTRIAKTVLAWAPASFDIRLLSARALVFQQQIPKAIEEFKRLETVYPTAPEPKYEMAVALVQSGATDSALQKLEEVIQLYPDYLQAVILQAELKRRTGAADEAVDSLFAFTQKHPTASRARLILASAYAQEGKLGEALAIYREFVRSDPSVPEFRFLAGSILMQQKKFREARELFEQAQASAPSFLPAVEGLVDLDLFATNYPSALQRCARLAEITNSATPMLLEAKVHMARRDFKAVEDALTRAEKREPNSLAVLSSQARVYTDLKDYDKALEKLDTILKLNPKFASAWLQKGVVYEAKRESVKAKDAYQRVIGLSPNHAAALNNLAFILSEEPGKLDEALALATKARQATPADPSIADTLGWVNYKQRNFGAARALFAEASAKLDVAEVHYHLGLTDYALVNEQGARQSLEKALQGNLGPKLRDDAAARLAVLKMNPASASPSELAQVEAVAKRDPVDYLAQLRLGFVYQHQNDFDKAKTAFEAAGRANPQASAPYLHLARLLSGKDDARAYEAAKNARKLDPNDASVALVYGELAVRHHDYSAALNALPQGLAAPESTVRDSYSLAVAQYAMGQAGVASATLHKLVAGNDPTAQLARDALTLITVTNANAVQRTSLAEARLKADPNDLLALVARAEINEQQNENKEAARRFEKAVELAPAFWPARRRLAYLYAERLSDDKSALTHATKVRQAVPDDAVTAHVLGQIAFRRKDFATALRYFQEVARISPASGEPLYFVGLASLRLNRTNDSKVAFTKALKLPLSPDLAKETSRVLSELK